MKSTNKHNQSIEQADSMKNENQVGPFAGTYAAKCFTNPTNSQREIAEIVLGTNLTYGVAYARCISALEDATKLTAGIWDEQTGVVVDVHRRSKQLLASESCTYAVKRYDSVDDYKNDTNAVVVAKNVAFVVAVEKGIGEMLSTSQVAIISEDTNGRFKLEDMLSNIRASLHSQGNFDTQEKNYIFSPRAANITIEHPDYWPDNAGFWSNSGGWVTLDKATAFSAEAQRNILLPRLEDDVLQWLTQEEAVTRAWHHECQSGLAMIP